MLQRFSELVNQQESAVAQTVAAQIAPLAPELVVAQSTLDKLGQTPEALLDDTIDFVTHLLTRGSLSRADIPAQAVQAYCCDFYLGQVAAGGHAQFIENSRHILDATLRDVQDAFAAIGSRAHLEVVIRLTDLIAAHPEDFQKDKGFSVNIAGALASLDDVFFSIDPCSAPRAQLGQWIAKMPYLKPVPDAEVLPTLTQISKRKAPVKIVTREDNVTRYGRMLRDTLSLGLGMASARAIDPVVKIGRPASMRLNGMSTSCWKVRTNNGEQLGVVTGSGATLYAIAGEGSPSLRKDLLAMNVENVLKHEMPVAGEAMAHVPRKEIDIAAGFCDRLMAAEAVDAVLSKLPIPAVADFVSLRGYAIKDDGAEVVALMVVADNATSAYGIIVEETGAQLLSEPDHTLLAKVSRAEINKQRLPEMAIA